MNQILKRISQIFKSLANIKHNAVMFIELETEIKTIRNCDYPTIAELLVEVLDGNPQLNQEFVKALERRTLKEIGELKDEAPV